MTLRRHRHGVTAALVVMLAASGVVACSGAGKGSASPVEAEDKVALQRVLDRIVAADNAGDLGAVMVLRRQPGGEWKIARPIWNRSSLE